MEAAATYMKLFNLVKNVVVGLFKIVFILPYRNKMMLWRFWEIWKKLGESWEEAIKPGTLILSLEQEKCIRPISVHLFSCLAVSVQIIAYC